VSAARGTTETYSIALADLLRLVEGLDRAAREHADALVRLEEAVDAQAERLADVAAGVAEIRREAERLTFTRMFGS
jgi:hypothetical protein